MKQFYTVITILVVLAIAVILALAAGKPDTFRVERSIVIKAGVTKIYPLINDFHNWTAWSPYEKMDPGIKRTYSGPATGKGSIYAWESKNMGGQMEITDSNPNTVDITINFTRPMQAQNMVRYTLEPSDGSTKVTWAMYGPNSYAAKLMHVFMDMDVILGAQFEEGLTMLKSAAEAPEKKK